MKIRYSEEAIGDLQRLRSFIAEHNPSAAARIGAELAERIEMLADFPAMGQAVEAAPQPDTIRDMIFGNYVVRYLPSKSAIIILRIWHHFEER